MSMELIETKCAGTVRRQEGSNPRQSYEHQTDAMKCLSIINQYDDFSTLVVLPTGGGKTYTASSWLLTNAIDKGKKVLWLAHRQMLLDQAAESFQQYATAETMPNKTSFDFRIVSGASYHDKLINIAKSDDLLILSKDSVGRNMNMLDNWLNGQQTLYLVVDEAHHAIARTYRKVIDYVRENVPHVKIIGLTATPFRTADNERGLLAKIFHDGVIDGKAVKNDVGIAYRIGLKDLIAKRILAKPTFDIKIENDDEICETLGLEALNKIQNFDQLPDEIVEKMAKSATRNKKIVDMYLKHKDEFGQTIVFVLNITHAIQLNKVFTDAGVKSAYVCSQITDRSTGVVISKKENEENIAKYKSGEIQVLINVNILTEGVDLPKTKTVILARPTVSMTLMTQMVGRALRGPAAGGTEDAYIVPVIDNWSNNCISWVSPESIFDGDNDFKDDIENRYKKYVRWIQIAKIEEFANILNSSIDTSALEALPFEERIPIGMYSFKYVDDCTGEDEGIDHFCQVMVYDSTVDSYKTMLSELPELFKTYNVEDLNGLASVVDEMEQQCAESYFTDNMIPPYDPRDIINILKYYAYCGDVPTFYTFDDVMRERLDVTTIAKRIVDSDMGQRKKDAYLNSIWEDGDQNIIRLFFSREMFFRNQVDIEINKISRPDLYAKAIPNIDYGQVELESLPLHELGKYNPQLERELREGAFAKAKNAKGEYECKICGRAEKTRRFFQVDHKTPINKGGKSVPENLQILCRSCNARKSDKL
ncbi:MAG: DEAD/DEAH box helicase family protein [Bacteroidales bacterium]|nr:DEAD/DEAH box helicase family protein [Salinivirgaceae bacterium]MBO7482235.1 DEAD/DEAH box helicase family protein [Bacteroidales bacterium]